MGSQFKGFAYDTFLPQLEIAIAPALVELACTTIGMRCIAFGGGMGIACPGCRRAARPHGISGQGCVRAQFFEICGMARGFKCRYS